MEHNEIYAGAQMLIRKPVLEVFSAFINPEQTVNFWFTKSSGPLKKGKRVTWEWEMYGVKTEVIVREIIENELIEIDWGEPSRRVAFRFSQMENGTYIDCRETGFTETGSELLAAIRNSTGGFTTVVDGLKSWLEHGIGLNLIADKFPKGK